MSAPVPTSSSSPAAGPTTQAPLSRRARVPFSFDRLRLVAANTFLEAVRQKLFNVLVLLAVGLVVSAQFFREFNFGSSELKFITDFGFGAIVFFGSALTVAATAQLFFSEIENRTALTLLAKPVWRAEFVFGKFLGVFAVVGVFCALMTGLLLAMLWTRETALMELYGDDFASGRVVRYGEIIVAAALQWVKFGVLTAITLLVASFSNTNLFTVIISFFVLVICHLQYLARDAYANVSALPLKLAVQLLGFVFPNFQLFNLAEEVTGRAALDWQVPARAAVYGVIYIGVFGGLAVYSFRSREI